jgi:hypothetical protein
VEADYDTYKTKLANLDAYSEALNHEAYCAATAADFSSLEKSGDLMAAIAGERLIVGQVCDAPVLAAAKPTAQPPLRVALADAVVAPPNRQPPNMPYADAPPPAPSSQPVSSGHDDHTDARPSQASNPAGGYDEANYVPPRPSPLYQIRDDKYWYYRWVYSQPGAYAGYNGR